MLVLAFLGIAALLGVCSWLILDSDGAEQFFVDSWVSITKFATSLFSAGKQPSGSELEYLEDLCTSFQSTAPLISELLVTVRRAIAKEVELEKTTEAALSRKKEFAAKWHERATNAVHDKNDALAKQALHKKALYQKEAQTYSHVLHDTRKHLSELNEHLIELEAMSSSVTNKLNVLTLRARLASRSTQAYRKVAAVHRHQSLVSIEHAVVENELFTDEKFITASRSTMRSFSRLFEKMENEVVLLEDEATLWAERVTGKSSGEKEKDAKDTHDAIERELDNLKKKKKKKESGAGDEGIHQ